MNQNKIEALAKRFHETYERLAPPEVVPVPWSELSPESSRLLIMVIGIVMQDVTTETAEAIDAQRLEFDRNHWQRKVGILLSLIASHSDDTVGDCGGLHAAAVKAVNTNWFTQGVGDPIADIAQMTVSKTIVTAVEAGIVSFVPEVE
ncbi:MAG: hypothetical protein DRH08_00290 [Deltaproteobacteria bacterium]|nr:MAG: hypothetical protein DRH08_00290 [Deltaproteobacteria bacterium]